jgi:hypothetical protein
MRIGKKPKNGSKHYPNTGNKPRRRSWKTIAIALYITFILLSTFAYLADRSVEPNMKDSYEYHLTYPRDGRQTHYYVERVNTSRIGKIDLVYTTASNSLDVDVYNVKVLYIYCRSMYEDECQDVYGIDPWDNTNYYKWYFIEKNHFNVNIDSDHEIEDLSFIDTPLAYKVVVNDERWTEGVDYFYEGHSIALSNVPAGHTNVDLYFKPDTGTPPNAVLKANRTLVQVDDPVTLDGSESYDSDGTITEHIFDFGDGIFKGGSKHSHQYSKPGVYGVILTVRDNEYLVDHAYINITVTTNYVPDKIRVPDQEKSEDSPPWSLNLSLYEPPESSLGIEFYWYITGENTSLYTLVGENSTDDQFVFTPIPDAYGSNLVTLWMHSSENITTSQLLWINITPVNDPPTILPIPDLIVHYDDPYTFNYEPYVDDKETPIHELLLDVFDGYEKQYISINGLNVTYNYPQDLVGETIYVTVTVSDGEAFAQDVISIQITSDHVPKLVKTLPDVWLYEGTTKYNVFDLDDYFTDPDNDAIYFSYGQSHVDISINLDHTVDISAESEWTGSELVTFRARDPIGALAEDSIIVTVLPVNDPPTISGVPNFYIRYDNDYRFDLTPYVRDNDNITEELLITTSDPQYIRPDIRNNMVIIMNYPEEFLDQTRSVRLMVSDGLDSGFQDVDITITKDFPPELLSPLPDIIFLEDQPLLNAFNLDHYFLDVDGDILYYTTGNEHINITINVDHSIDFSAPKDWFGAELVYFRATDPTGALQQDLIWVIVLPVNDPPIINEIPPQAGNESERWMLELEPYLFDVDNNLSELEITVDTDFVVVSGSSLIFLGSPQMPKQIEITASDGEYSASRTIDVKIRLNKGPKAYTFWDLLATIIPFLIIIILILALVAGAIYRKKSKFQAEEVFLIHTGGTLITHLSRSTQANVDDIIFSGMFTAVQDFIKDTFVSDADRDDESMDDKWALDELKLGDNNILIERSKHTYLAVIFSGEGSKRLRRIVNRLLDKIENKYSNVLPTWDGNINALRGTKEILSVLIKPKDELEPTSIPAQAMATKTDIPTLKQLQPRQPPSPTPTQGPTRPTVSRSLTAAKIAKPPKKRVITKNLLECSRTQTDAKKPGLTPWPIKTSKKHVLTNIDMKKLPMALHIQSKRLLPKTIVIKKDQIMINEKPANISLPKGMDINKNKTPIKFSDPQTGKEFKLDPSKSLLQQLAEMDNK